MFSHGLVKNKTNFSNGDAYEKVFSHDCNRDGKGQLFFSDLSGWRYTDIYYDC